MESDSAEQSKPWLMYLYSQANLWGSIAGLCGVGLWLIGLIGPGWWAIAAGLYGVGALLAPRQKMLHFSSPIADWSNIEAIQARLDQGRAALENHANRSTCVILDSINQHLLELLPKLEQHGLMDEDARVIRETISRYLPETLEYYLKLPVRYRQRMVLREGKTAEQLLAGQLKIIDQQMVEIGQRLLHSQAQNLLAQGRFLEDKFNKPDLLNLSASESIAVAPIGEATASKPNTP